MSKLILDGKLVEQDTVAMPVVSRGYAFGFGVFETMKFMGGQPCFFGEHIDRLRRALAGAGLDVELCKEALRGQARFLFAAEGVEDGVFKIVVADNGAGGQVAIFVKERTVEATPKPVRLVASNVRKASNAFTSRHKSLNYMESVLELQKAVGAGYDECVFRNERGELTECAVANLFWVREGVLFTPSLDCGLLDGIVRQKVIDLAIAKGMAVQAGCFEERALMEADEAFVTSSGKGPRSADSYTDEAGVSKVFEAKFLSGLRKAFLDCERKEALGEAAC